jgi:very-short-patch-repair endonuclease
VHLPTLVDNKVVGQNWRGAFRHISEKSVDFVLCDKEYLSPKLAIELDDKTHERPERQERDREVERILQDAGVPLLRIINRGRFNASELAEQVRIAVAAPRAVELP